MRRLRYNVAMSLDGFIADPNGGYDWIIMDPAIDFGSMFAEFDAFVMGRKTFEVTIAQGDFVPMFEGKEVIVFSRTLRAADYPGATIVADDPVAMVSAMKAKPGRDIWLFGGGALFRTLVDANLVDTVEVGVIPVLLSEGVPVLPPGEQLRGLQLAECKALPSGILMLSYTISRET